jgi:hypothetical protein
VCKIISFLGRAFGDRSVQPLQEALPFPCGQGLTHVRAARIFTLAVSHPQDGTLPRLTHRRVYLIGQQHQIAPTPCDSARRPGSSSHYNMIAGAYIPDPQAHGDSQRLAPARDLDRTFLHTAPS